MDNGRLASGVLLKLVPSSLRLLKAKIVPHQHQRQFLEEFWNIFKKRINRGSAAYSLS